MGFGMRMFLSCIQESYKKYLWNLQADPEI